MAGKNGEICTVKESGPSLKGDRNVVQEASRFESILKEAFGVPQKFNLSYSLAHFNEGALGQLGAEESLIDNGNSPAFGKAVYEQVARDLAHDKSTPALILQGPDAPYLSIQNKPTTKDYEAALPGLIVVMPNTRCER